MTSKITELTPDTTPSYSDLIETAKDPGGTPLSRGATLLNALKGAALGVLTADNDVFARVGGVLTRIPVGASTFLGRKASGNVVAMTPAEALALLDYDGKVLGRASLSSGGTLSISSSSDADVDATNLIVTFTVPSSGSVDVQFEGGLDIAGDNVSAYADWFVRESTSLVGTRYRVFGVVQADVTSGTPQTQARVHCEIRITGLTPGASKTYKWGWRRASGSAAVNMYPTDAPLVMTVKAVA